MTYQTSWGADVIDRTDWKQQLTAYGRASDAGTADILHRVWDGSDNGLAHLLSAVLHQSTLFPVAEPVTRCLLPRCESSGATRDLLRPFWDEWLYAVDMIKVPVTPNEAQIRSAHAVVGELDDEEIEVLWEDPSDDSPIGVLMRHTICRCSTWRERVVQMLSR